MNLIPFTMIFILILTLSTFGLMQGLKMTTTTVRTCSGYMNAFREGRSAVEKSIFASEQKKEKSNTKHLSAEEKKKARKGKRYPGFREKYQTENAMYNIAPLFTNKNSLLEEALVRLIVDLYGKKPFFKGVSPDDLVHEVLEAGRRLKKEELELSHISLGDSPLQETWYKILRGTPDYNLKKKKGWPPLSHFVVIHPSHLRKPICYNKASIPLLQSFFGPVATEMILKTEEKRYFDGLDSPISASEFTEILAKCNLSDLGNYVGSNLHEKDQRDKVKTTDSASGVTAEVKKL
jgi:hypothetical protein